MAGSNIGARRYAVAVDFIIARRDTVTTQLFHFVSDTRFDDIPDPVRNMARRCILDLTGTAAAGLSSDLSRIIRNIAVRSFNAGDGAPRARIIFDGRTASPAGAAMAGGMTIDSFDAHDGHVLTKGHAGCAIFPALLALADSTRNTISGADLMAALVIGYEVAIRAGIAQHATAPDYHTSGAWNALGVVAMAARLQGLDQEAFRQALGIAEYHGPRSQMMRCIDFPTMVKDGSGWGAMCGVSAAELASEGFTGAPALVVESDSVRDLWIDLGTRWRILEIYFKPYPICRWAQPAVEASLVLRQTHGVTAPDIEAIEVETFHEAVRLDQHRPASTEEAQYSLPFPVAAAVVRGRLAPTDISGAALHDPEILAMSDRILLREADDLNARFPAERFARVTFRLKDGRVLQSETTPARGDAERPLSDLEILEKFKAVASEALGTRAGDIVAAVDKLPEEASSRTLLDLLLNHC